MHQNPNPWMICNQTRVFMNIHILPRRIMCIFVSKGVWGTSLYCKTPWCWWSSQGVNQPTNQTSSVSHNQPTNKQTNNRRNPTTNQSPSTRSHPTTTPVSWGNKQGHLSTTLDTAPGSWPQLTGCFDSESLVIPHMFRCLATTWTLPPLDSQNSFIVGRIGMTRQLPSYAHSTLGSLVW